MVWEKSKKAINNTYLRTTKLVRLVIGERGVYYKTISDKISCKFNSDKNASYFNKLNIYADALAAKHF